MQAKLRVYDSNWSQSFSMDTIGSSGVVICHNKERQRKYMVCNLESVYKILQESIFIFFMCELCFP